MRGSTECEFLVDDAAKIICARILRTELARTSRISERALSRLSLRARRSARSGRPSGQRIDARSQRAACATCSNTWWRMPDCPRLSRKPARRSAIIRDLVERPDQSAGRRPAAGRRAMAALSRRAIPPTSTRSARCATRAAQLIAGLQKQYVEANRRGNAFESQTQQCAGLFRRDHRRPRPRSWIDGKEAATERLRADPPPDHGERGALHDRRALRTRRQDLPRRRPRAWRSSCDLFDELVHAQVLARGRKNGPRRALRWLNSMSPPPWRRTRRRPHAMRRPVLSETYGSSDITGGRHPVVEAVLERWSRKPRSWPNDCDAVAMTSRRRGGSGLLTGPNMAGKSDLPAPERPDHDPRADR
jgi:hypothetical protein